MTDTPFTLDRTHNRDAMAAHLRRMADALDAGAPVVSGGLVATDALSLSGDLVLGEAPANAVTIPPHKRHAMVLRAMRTEGSMMGVPTELAALDAAIAALSEHGGGREAEPFAYVLVEGNPGSCAELMFPRNARKGERGAKAAWRELGEGLHPLYLHPPVAAEPVAKLVNRIDGDGGKTTTFIRPTALGMDLPLGEYPLYTTPPTPSAPVVDDAVAQALWHRFGDDSRMTWDEEPEKAIYRDAAAQVAALSGVSAPVGVEGWTIQVKCGGPDDERLDETLDQACIRRARELGDHWEHMGPVARDRIRAMVLRDQAAAGFGVVR